MTLKLFFYLLVLPRVSAIFKAFLKPIEPVSIATTDIIGLLHPEKISTFISIGANDGKKNDPLYPYIKKK